MRSLVAAALVLAACHGSGAGGSGGGDDGGGGGGVDGGGADGGVLTDHAIQTVFLIVMENKNWAAPSPDPVIVGNPSAPYLNSLIATSAIATDYHNPPAGHPSEVDYLWLEGGESFGMLTDASPSATNSTASTAHLVDLLEGAGVSWRAYVEDITGDACPLHAVGDFVPRHVPFVFFRDVTDDNSAVARRCLDHVVPFAQLAPDLASGTQAHYDFIAGNLCDDMHGAPDCPADHVASGDSWLAQIVPMIEASPVYQGGHAAILITWDESNSGDYPIGMLAISPHARAGYASSEPLSHSSTLRTLEEVFGVGPLLGDARNARSLADLFSEYP